MREEGKLSLGLSVCRGTSWELTSHSYDDQAHGKEAPVGGEQLGYDRLAELLLFSSVRRSCCCSRYV